MSKHGHNGHTKFHLLSAENFLRYSIFCLILALFSVVPFRFVGAQTPTHSYSFDENSGVTAEDLSGSDDGTLTNGVLWSTGKNGAAVLFDGIDDKVALPSTFDISSLPLTIEAWVKPSDYNNYHNIFSQRSSWSSSNMRVDIGMDIDDGRIYVGQPDTFYFFSYAPPLNTWTHIALVADLTGVSLYANGVFQESLDPIILGTGEFSLAHIGGTGDDQDYFSGLIDDVRIYNRVLTQVEINGDMNTPVTAPLSLEEKWQVNVPDGGSFTDPVTSLPWELDGGSLGYLFTAVTADANYVYTARGHHGSWNSPSCSLQKWDADNGALVNATAPDISCSGIYDLELKVYNGDGLGLVRLYAYRQGDVEIRDKATLALLVVVSPNTTAPSCGNPSCDHTTPGVANGSVAKRKIARSDGLDIYVEHSDTPPNPGTYGNSNPLNIYMDTSVMTLPTWVTDVVPAPTTDGLWLYFGAEDIALSPAEDYIYIAGGNKAGGVLSSRIEKRDLPVLPDPYVSIDSAPDQIDYNEYVNISWSSLYADRCDITSSPSVWSASGLAPSGYESNIGPINPPVTFTALCTRDSDGKIGESFINVTYIPNQPPTAFINIPATDIARPQGSAIDFDALGSSDLDGTSITHYEWWEGGCRAGTPLSPNTTLQAFSKDDFPLGVHTVYLSVQDDDGAWSLNCPYRTISIPPQCFDNDDNDGDFLIDEDDPGCWTDTNNPATYDQNINSENTCGNNMCEPNIGENVRTCRADCRIRFYDN